ncbi:glycosyltransferase [Microbacterium wangchenii]|uniref:glycosyltransferase n=1 Tax=Microbacterium wangchenii TaxID=2541726 RepID=UPI0011CB945A|nr:glycosyltransferase family 1 protein [Microbacterium wangchenii]
MQPSTRPSVAIIGTRGYPSYYGGFETAVRHLAPYLAESGWDVTVYGRRGATKPEDAARDERVQSVLTKGVESSSLSTLSYGLTASWDAAIRRPPSAALVMNVANGFFLPLLSAKNIPTLVNVDGIEWERQKWGRLAKSMFRVGAKLTARYGTELVFDAKAIGDRWRSEFGRDGVFIPYGGTAPGELDPVPQFAAGTYALAVARFVPENTIPEFLEAARILAKNHPVVIVGSTGYGGDLDARAQALVDSEPNVHWLGHVSDDTLLFALLRNAGVYFHGHSVGGTNPALVQAMACGAPIVARDTIYNREVLGDAGVFVAPTPRAIAAGLEAMITSPHSRALARQNALARSAELYTWESVCAAYERALRKLVNARAL